MVLTLRPNGADSARRTGSEPLVAAVVVIIVEVEGFRDLVKDTKIASGLPRGNKNPPEQRSNMKSIKDPKAMSERNRENPFVGMLSILFLNHLTPFSSVVCSVTSSSKRLVVELAAFVAMQ